jgi:hypothetical protein
MAKKVIKNFALDEQLCIALQRSSARRGESMSLLVRESLRSHPDIIREMSS